DVIVGIRPEHFEDAAVHKDTNGDHMKFRTKIDVVESMGSELYVYFDVHAERLHIADLDELAADAGLGELASHGDGPSIVARLSAESKASRGNEAELVVDTSRMKLFDDSGKSLVV
ncbi:MAG TPA: ABC transporter ATP-binding protein, partial [Solirubrobacteraceae bacterium]|nr:ABC transporter ATP-binding protein [Solirubrobacteraceae bacterium]